MGDAITVMEHTGMARRVPPRPHPLPVHYGTSGEEYADWLDAVDRGDSTPPSPALTATTTHPLVDPMAALPGRRPQPRRRPRPLTIPAPRSQRPVLARRHSVYVRSSTKVRVRAVLRPVAPPAPQQ